MTKYVTFARKYRPKNFVELHGQEILVKILTYAIMNQRLAQSYLLTGIRGVGKTTSARIIAKTINCTNQLFDELHVKPCENCQNCLSFNNQNHPDIIEIDAASRTSVDDVRKIIESCEYRPLLAKYKVFIIDEIHMLSKGAFNALLKILEEPPPHVIFIFATTEVQKLPLTVISRCQRYDLRRLSFDEIFNLIRQIADLETIKYEPEALKIIAYKSEGSARDAISMLDQASSSLDSQNNVVTTSIINQMLGLMDVASVVSFMQYIVDKDVSSAIKFVNDIYAASVNLELFTQSVSDFIAHLTKVKMIKSYKDPIYDSFNDIVQKLLLEINVTELSILWQIYNKAIIEIKISHNQLIEMEMLVIKSIYSQIIGLNEDIKLSTAKPDEYKFTDFLTYLYSKKEVEIYYLLLNQAEIRKFIDNQVEIISNNISNSVKEEIISLLYAWSGQKWNAIIERSSPNITLKKQLMDKLQSSADWKILVEHFPDATISDILLKH